MGIGHEKRRIVRPGRETERAGLAGGRVEPEAVDPFAPLSSVGSHEDELLPASSDPSGNYEHGQQQALSCSEPSHIALLTLQRIG